jgi:AraC family transcriptional regulator of adaptative response/methylated-DNA-[protein]-cysteine methyltransferase
MAQRLKEARRKIQPGRGLSGSGPNRAPSSRALQAACTRVFDDRPAGHDPASVVSVHIIDSPLGSLVAAATPRAVVMLEFADPFELEQRVQRLESCFHMSAVSGSSPPIRLLEQQLKAYFDGCRREFDVPLEYPGTPFERRVWSALLTIPYGQTRSYAGVAAQVGQPAACRAVGMANGRNRLAILLPCHRVVNKNGEIGGYGGGLWRKRYLLDLERRHV